jgi:hypothetical protein
MTAKTKLAKNKELVLPKSKDYRKGYQAGVEEVRKEVKRKLLALIRSLD